MGKSREMVTIEIAHATILIFSGGLGGRLRLGVQFSIVAFNVCVFIWWVNTGMWNSAFWIGYLFIVFF
jgi:hypothetical protein